jgi:hypothetical protein
VRPIERVASVKSILYNRAREPENSPCNHRERARDNCGSPEAGHTLTAEHEGAAKDRTMKLTYLLLLLALLVAPAAFAQTEPQRVAELEHRVSKLERKIRKVSEKGLVLVLFGAFCALWAQNTGRNAWLWFFLGLLFSIITVLVLLWKNSADLDLRRAQAPPR